MLSKRLRDAIMNDVSLTAERLFAVRTADNHSKHYVGPVIAFVTSVHYL